MHEVIAVVVVHNFENEGFPAISSDRLGQAKTKVPSSLSSLSYASAATGTRGNVVMVTWVNAIGNVAFWGVHVTLQIEHLVQLQKVFSYPFNKKLFEKIQEATFIIGLLRGVGPRGGGSLIFPNVP